MSEVSEAEAEVINENEADKNGEGSDDSPRTIHSRSFYAILEDIELTLLDEDEIPRRISFLPQHPADVKSYVKDIYKQNEEIAVRLTKMKLNNQQPEPIVDLDTVPDSFKNNSDSEKCMLKMAEKFIWDFKQNYPARPEPFIIAYNECGVQKLLPTYILPVDLPHFELHQWEACAEFVADYLSYEGLDLPIRPPFMVPSPAYSVQHQNGNSLDFSMVLCSILLARGYDAYVVHGYAAKEVCELDEREKVYEKKEDENEKIEESSDTNYKPMRLKLLCKPKELSTAKIQMDSLEEANESMKKYNIKYGPRPPRQLYSKFQQAMQRKRESQMSRVMSIKENPKVDVLCGCRVHFWVLVRPKDISSPDYFYIEPSTGEKVEINDPNYKYVESVWNNSNFWINLQSHQVDKENFYFSLSDTSLWKPLLKREEGTIMNLALQEEESMPSSWTLPITLSREDISRHYPDGKKVRYFRNLKFQTFTPFSMPDGLVSKITFYSDEEYKLPIEIIEYYFNRSDHLIKQSILPTKNVVFEYFSSYRADGLKEHIHNISDLNNWEDERIISFRSSARADGLSKITRSKNILTEEYEGREDRLYQKIITLASENDTSHIIDRCYRVISSIEENYHRNPSIHCDDDIEKRIFDIKNKRYFVKFHTGEDRIAYSYLQLQKPTEKVKGHGFDLTPDMWKEYQVDDEAPPRSRIDVYHLAAKLVEDESKAVTALQNSQKIITDILQTRLKERAQLELEPSVHDVHKNEYAKKKERESIETEEGEEKEEMPKPRKPDDEMKWDCLAPYLLELGSPSILTPKQAQRVFQSCLLDCRNHLFHRRDKIQSDLKKERELLAEKVEWFKRFQSSLLKEQEEEHQEFLTKTQLNIEVLEERLKKWYEKTPKFLKDLKEQLKNDYRLAKHVK